MHHLKLQTIFAFGHSLSPKEARHIFPSSGWLALCPPQSGRNNDRRKFGKLEIILLFFFFPQFVLMAVRIDLLKLLKIS